MFKNQYPDYPHGVPRKRQRPYFRTQSSRHAKLPAHPSSNRATSNTIAAAAPSSCHEGDSQRHWMLDHFVGRDVLISQLLCTRPELAPPWNVLRAPGLDALLEPLIDSLGYRNTPAPSTYLEDLKMSTRLLGCFIKLQCLAIASAVNRKLGRPTP